MGLPTSAKPLASAAGCVRRSLNFNSVHLTGPQLTLHQACLPRRGRQLLAIACCAHSSRCSYQPCSGTSFITPYLQQRRHLWHPHNPCNHNTARRVQCHALRLHNRELLIGDVTLLVCFALWKQIAAICMAPNFPGWLAPLAFNPLRFLEFFSFTLTLCGVWVSAAAVVGGYTAGATKDLPTTLRLTSLAWLASMPVAAAQLVLVTALESKALVGDAEFASALPLAAMGVGEPFCTAAGVLGVMTVWRSYYCVYLDWWSNSGQKEAETLHESTRMVMIMAAVSLTVLEAIQLTDLTSTALLWL